MKDRSLIFSMQLDVSVIRSQVAVEIDPEEADFFVVSSAIGEALDEAGAHFTAGGFGTDEWPVDVRFDLALLLPDVLDCLDSLAHGEPGELGFVEQGLQRVVHVEPSGDRVELRCSSFGTWVPAEPTGSVPLRDITEMLVKLERAVAAGLEVAAPALYVRLPSAWVR